jgi:NAD(P)-dependent dehydrogenase (short-subunit alcohol dehydrogenase family)
VCSRRAAAYAATKGAIDTLVKHFASVLGNCGIRVNAVAPAESPAGRSCAIPNLVLRLGFEIAGVVTFVQLA